MERKQAEERIFQILNYINQTKLSYPLEQNIKLFSSGELLQLLDFLETWDYQLIYDLIDKKYKEYIYLIREIKTIKISSKMQKIKETEKKEKDYELKRLDNLLNF